MRFLTGDYLQFAVRIIMGGLFIYAGLGKILTPLEFAASIYNYKLLPEMMIGLAAVTIPWVEFLSGTALLIGIKIKGASLSISTLLIVFISILIISAARGLDVDCGCFSGVERHVGWLAISEDLAMLTGALFIYFFDRGKISLAGRYANRRSS